MNGRGLIIAVISVGVGLGGLTLNGQRTTNRAIEGLRVEMTEVRSDIADLRERMARLEGLFEGHVQGGCDE